MPLNVDDNGPTNFPEPQTLTLSNFKRGVINLINQSRTPKNALIEAQNVLLAEDGQPTIRYGIDWYGAAMPNGEAIDGFDYFDHNGEVHLVAVAGGVVYRSTDNAKSWDACTGATLTAGKEVNFNQNGSYLYIVNGEDNIVLYDGSTTLLTYAALTAPAAPTIAATGLSGTNFTYYYKISSVNKIGFSEASTTVTKQVSLPRSGWDNTSNYLTFTLPAYQTGQTRFDIYFSEDNLNFFYLDSVTTPNLTYKDNGTAIPIPSTLAPTGNTTQGPKVAELTNVGVRQYGVRDKDNRYRIWWTGAGAYSGAFSTAYDGGWLDWQPGGKYYPIHVEDYRDGKGDPLATIWMDSADGVGGIVQMSLDTLTIDTISVTIPSAYMLPGSRGTNAPNSVVNVLNDYIYYNQQAFYNLGSRAQFLNLLSTDEASANIRPTVRRITTAASHKICGIYDDANVFLSVPYGSDENNYTAVYNTELKAWLPEAFTVGFKRFMRYTSTESDGSKIRHLLAIKPGDNRLSRIDKSIQGDYGQPFTTSVTTGLYPVTQDRYEFQYTEEMEWEISNPRGLINIELIGYERKKGYGAVKLVPYLTTSNVTNIGWDVTSSQWDALEWDYADTVPQTFSESSSKRYTTVQKELNAVQWHISTNTLDAGYDAIRSLQTWGTQTNSGHPTRWRVRAR